MRELKKKLHPAKVNKDAIPAEIEPKVITDEDYRCTCCGKKYKRQNGNFFRSRSVIFKGNNGYLSICRSCMCELLASYTKFFDNDEYAALERICQIVDMNMDKSLWD